MSKAEWSGWSQAVVAAIAIGLGAFGLWFQARRQYQMEMERIRNQEVGSLKIIYGGIFDVRRRLLSVTEMELQAHDADWDFVDEAVSMLRLMPPLEVPDWKVAFALREAFESYAILKKCVPYTRIGIPPQSWFSTSRRMIVRAVYNFGNAQRVVEESLAARRANTPEIRIEFTDGVRSSLDAELFSALEKEFLGGGLGNGNHSSD